MKKREACPYLHTILGNEGDRLERKGKRRVGPVREGYWVIGVFVRPPVVGRDFKKKKLQKNARKRPHPHYGRRFPALFLKKNGFGVI
ncbi:hypothetical protein HanIR_Chr02g0074211 [Helianthus annuus]|nr:hypothetical protein HanIR_Chr02g0074211 [Helianthus annuus]